MKNETKTYKRMVAQINYTGGAVYSLQVMKQRRAAERLLETGDYKTENRGYGFYRITKVN